MRRHMHGLAVTAHRTWRFCVSFSAVAPDAGCLMENEFEIEMQPSRTRDRLATRSAGSLVGQVLQASRRSGASPVGARQTRARGTGHHGRGRDAALRANRILRDRRVVIKARVVKHTGSKFASAPISRHIAYLQREGVTRDKARGELFDADHDHADGEGFSSRCDADRHHFRFIVSPEDAVELGDLRAFTRELMDDMARDMNTPLEWVAAEHWNTDNPHVHILVRGKTSIGSDLVIDREYMRHGLRWRAEDRVSVELGLRNDHELNAATRREISAERWTGLDRELAQIQEREGSIDLRHDPGEDKRRQANLIGRVNTLSRLGLADEIEPGRWRIGDNAEQTLRSLELRGDIIKSMHHSMSHHWRRDLAQLPTDQAVPGLSVTGRLIHHEPSGDLPGGAHVVIEGVDGRRHGLPVTNVVGADELSAGAIVRVDLSRNTNERSTLSMLSALTLEQQVTASGPTWLDQQLAAPDSALFGEGFGQEVHRALSERATNLVAQGLGHMQNGKPVLGDHLLDELKQRELAEATRNISRSTGLMVLPSGLGDHVAGTCRQQVDLNSGRFAMIDNGMGFQLVPWEPALARRLGQEVSGLINHHGGVDWSFDRSRSIGL